MKEIFKDIKGYEGIYQISNQGKVKSLVKSPMILRNNLGDTGYYRVNLYKNKTKKTRKIHQLVAEAFLNHVPNGFSKIVDHIDNNPLNNNLNNLQLVSNRVNTSKDKVSGTSKYTGVCWGTRQKKWLATMKYKGKSVYIGGFDNEKEASIAYQNKLKEIND